MVLILQDAFNPKEFLTVDYHAAFFIKVGIHNHIRNPRLNLSAGPLDLAFRQRNLPQSRCSLGALLRSLRCAGFAAQFACKRPAAPLGGRPRGWYLHAPCVQAMLAATDIAQALYKISLPKPQVLQATGSKSAGTLARRIAHALDKTVILAPNPSSIRE